MDICRKLVGREALVRAGRPCPAGERSSPSGNFVPIAGPKAGCGQDCPPYYGAEGPKPSGERNSPIRLGRRA